MNIRSFFTRNRTNAAKLLVSALTMVLSSAILPGAATAASSQGDPAVPPYARADSGTECPAENTAVTCETSASADPGGALSASTTITAMPVGTGMGKSWAYVGDYLFDSPSWKWGSFVVASFFIKEAWVSPDPLTSGYAAVYLYVCARTNASSPDCLSEGFVRLADTRASTKAPEQATDCSAQVFLRLPDHTGKFHVNAYLVTQSELGKTALGGAVGSLSASATATLGRFEIIHGPLPPPTPPPPHDVVLSTLEMVLPPEYCVTD